MCAIRNKQFIRIKIRLWMRYQILKKIVFQYLLKEKNLVDLLPYSFIIFQDESFGMLDKQKYPLGN